MLDEDENNGDLVIDTEYIRTFLSSKLHMSQKEIGKLTHLQYMKRKNDYENMFDIELMLTLCKKTYQEFNKENETENNVNDINFVNKYL